MNYQEVICKALRRVWYQYSKERRECIKLAARGVGWQQQYQCAKCGGLFKKNEVHVDHILPVTPTSGFDSFEKYIERLFCPPSGLQVLCAKTCHRKKTNRESTDRRKKK